MTYLLMTAIAAANMSSQQATVPDELHFKCRNFAVLQQQLVAPGNRFWQDYLVASATELRKRGYTSQHIKERISSDMRVLGRADKESVARLVGNEEECMKLAKSM